MATALELTREGWQPYLKGAQRTSSALPLAASVQAEREWVFGLVRKAAHLLKSRFGVRRVILFGSLYGELADRIPCTIGDLDQIVERVERAWVRALRALDDQYAYVDSAALNLHGFYSGLERLFEIIARQVDKDVPGGKTWHRDLLLQMAHDLPEVKPAVISQDNTSALDEFRRFRHLVRNVYTVSIVPNKAVHANQSLGVAMVTNPSMLKNFPPHF